MSTQRSIADLVATLKGRLAVHQKQEAFHAQREAMHREQRSFHAAEIEKISRSLESFQAASATVLELADQAAAAAAAEEGDDIGPAYRPKLGRMVKLVLESRGAAERFGPNAITDEVNQRFGQRLRNPISVGQISVVLRRMHKLGQLRLVRRGKPYWEALYVRETAG